MLRVISDVHGKYEEYKEIIKDVDFSLQLGDMGFDYSPLSDVDPDKHRMFPGNHDQYDIVGSMKRNLGDFGYKVFGGEEFFFVRGGFSIDKKYRTTGYDWFPNEQLNRDQQDSCLKQYRKSKPKLMISHSAPSEIAKLIGNPMILHKYGFDPERFNTETQALLQKCFEAHRPSIHLFGHFHMNLDFIHKGTRFICRPELGYVDVKNGEIVE